MVAATPRVPEQPSATAKAPSAPAAVATALWRFARFVRDSWLSIDLRALAVFRIAFGVALIGNLYDHSKDGHLVAFFTNHGVLPNHLALQAPIQPRPWSLLFAFSLPGELRIAFFAIFVVYVLYAIGWKTKLMQVLVIICFVSLVNRNLLLQDGGSFVSTLLAVWTVFLPLGARYSVDRWLAARPTASQETATAVAPPSARKPSAVIGRWPADAPRHVSFVCLALLLQLAVIYAFNAANKTGITWRNGTAVHYVLWQSGTNTELAGFLRFHEPAWLSPLLTRGTLVFEWTAPVLALTPVFRTLSRRVLIVSMCLFHTGIAMLMSLGPFSYAMMAFAALLLTPADFAFLEPKMRSWAALLGRAVDRRAWLARWRAALEAWRARTAARTGGNADLSPAEGGLPWRRRFYVARVVAREAVAVVLFVAMLTELTIANANVPKRFRLEDRPGWMSEILYYLRIYQTWGMFSSDPPLDSGTVVVDATLADGSHIDPLTGRPPDFEAPLHGPWLMGHDWSEFIFYYPWDRHRVYREGLRDYVARQDEDQGWPADKKIRSFSLYWVSAMSPPPGSVQPHDLKRELLLSYVARAR